MTVLMHCGAGAVTRNELALLDRPEPRGPSHHPVAHDTFVEMIENRVKHTNFDIVETRYFLNREGNQLFGLYRMQPEHDTHQALLGFRNSHDMSFSAGLAMGTRVFVCDNMTFAGEILLRRKHTARILDELPNLIDQGLSRLRVLGQTQEQRIERYKRQQIDRQQGADLLLEALESGAINARDMKRAWQHFLEDPLNYSPHYRSLWTLYNTVTWTWKRSPAQLMGPIHSKSAKLHELLDMEAV